MKHYPKTTFAVGCKWCESCLHDGWGDGATRDQISGLASLVVSRFEELAHEAGDPSIHWIPRTSEVIGECMGETTDEYHWSTPVHTMDADLDELREQATSEVWNAVCGYVTSMTERVREIFNEQMTVSQAAATSGAPRSSITWAIRRGYLPAEKQGRAWYVWTNDLDKWLQARPGSGRHATAA